MLVSSVLLFALATPVAVGAGFDRLIGDWETDIANCEKPEPVSGRYILFELVGGKSWLYYGDYSTEGGDCELGAPDESATSISFTASCRYEELDREPADLSFAIEGHTMISDTAWFGSAGETYYQCEAPAPVDPAED